MVKKPWTWTGNEGDNVNTWRMTNNVSTKADVFKIWENRGLKHILGLIFSAEICNLDSSKYSVLSNSYFDKDW